MRLRRRKYSRAGAGSPRSSSMVDVVRNSARPASIVSDRGQFTGHNNGPSLDDDGPPVPRYCKYCRYWSPPSDFDVRAYEAFQLGLSHRRVRRPTGACDRVLLHVGKPLAFSATTDTFSCLNFSAKPPAPIRRGRGYVTVYSGDAILWSGHEEDLPEEFR